MSKGRDLVGCYGILFKDEQQLQVDKRFQVLGRKRMRTGEFLYAVWLLDYVGNPIGAAMWSASEFDNGGNARIIDSEPPNDGMKEMIKVENEIHFPKSARQPSKTEGIPT
jgi:hypothetical protein